MENSELKKTLVQEYGGVLRKFVLKMLFFAVLLIIFMISAEAPVEIMIGGIAIGLIFIGLFLYSNKLISGQHLPSLKTVSALKVFIYIGLILQVVVLVWSLKIFVDAFFLIGIFALTWLLPSALFLYLSKLWYQLLQDYRVFEDKIKSI